MPEISVRDINVPDSRYGIRKAKLHAQAEANRVGRRVYLQFDTPNFGRMSALVSRNHILFMNAPFWTYYPKGN